MRAGANRAVDVISTPLNRTRRKTTPVRRARVPDLLLPGELAAAFKQAPEAERLFGLLAPSCRHEYIQWINTAKKDETRARRVQQTISMLKSGRRPYEKHW